MTHERAKSTLPTLFSIVIVDLIGFGIVLPILPFYAKEFGASPTVLGLLLATHAAMQFVFSPIWGRLSDRIGRRPVILFTIAGTSVSLLMLGMAPSMGWLFVARTLSGIFGANISVATAYLSDVTEVSERTRWMGMIGASFGIGFLLGPAIGGLLAPYGHAVPMFAAAGLAAVNFLWAIVVLREPKQHEARATAGAGLRETLRNRLVRHLCMTNFLFSFAVTQLETVFAYFMMDRFDYDARQVAFLLVGMALVMGGIQGGGMRALSKRYGERTLLLGGLLLMAVGFFIMPSAHSVALLLVPLLLTAAGRAVAQPPLTSMVSLQADPQNRGSVMGAYQAAASLARVFGPVSAGVLYSLSDGNPMYLAGALLLVCFAATLRLSGKQVDAQPTDG